MMWTVIGFLGIAFLVLMAVAAMNEADEEEELRRFHPPDDDDGVSLRKDDPDGQYQR